MEKPISATGSTARDSASHPGFESNSIYNLLKAIKSYSSAGESNWRLVAEELAELHSRIQFNDDSWHSTGRVLASPGLRKAAFHAIDEGATTLLLMRVMHGFRLGSAVRYLEDLQSLGVLKPATKLLRPPTARGGPRVVVCNTPDSSAEQIQAVCDLHRRYEDPLYAKALELSKALLMECSISGRDELSYGDVVEYLKRKTVPRNVHPLAAQVTRELAERGMKVWRS